MPQWLPGRHPPRALSVVVGQVARFAGHARPSMTLDKYLHEFEAHKGNDIAARLGQAFSDVLESNLT